MGNSRIRIGGRYHVAACRLVTLVWIFTALMAICSPIAGASESRIALVVGNGAYVRDPLPNPARDAALIAETLASVGFNVIRVIDADRQAMRTALVDFARKLDQPGSVGLFYYAGHGVQVSGENYLLPVDVDIRTEREVLLQGINLKEILVSLRPDDNRLAVAVLDACRNNPFVGLTRGLSRGLAAVTAPAGTLIAFSTAPGEVAFDGTNGHSPYTAALARSIPTPGLSIEEVFKRTRQQVMRMTANAQVPWEHSSLTGQFSFMPAAIVTAVDREGADGNGTDVRLVELDAWERIRNATEASPFKAFLKDYPAGAFAELARHKLDKHDTRHTDWRWWLPQVVSLRPRNVAPNQAAEMYERALRLEAEPGSGDTLAQARALYRTAAEAGFVPAIFRLGWLVERQGRRARKAGGAADAFQVALTEAAAHYTKAAETGHGPSLRALATLHEFGDGVRQDLAEALRLYEQAAVAGDAAAMTSLGYLYATGKGVHRNPTKARDWYGKAADQGAERAMFNLAVMLMSNDGGEVNFAEAARWLVRASNAGHAGAMRQLAALYDQGRGLPRDSAAAAKYLLQAYAAGNKDAATDLFEHHRRWSRATRREIQRQLRQEQLYGGAIHGVFNSATRQALSNYGTKLASN